MFENSGVKGFLVIVSRDKRSDHIILLILLYCFGILLLFCYYIFILLEMYCGPSNISNIRFETREEKRLSMAGAGLYVKS